MRTTLGSDDWRALLDLHLPHRPPGQCWPWQGLITPKGYGRARLQYAGRRGPRPSFQAHRLAYTYFVGPIPSGAVIMHTCDNPPCCNPDHLRAGTVADNNRDMWAKGRGKHPNHPQPRRSHCQNGHPLTDEHVYLKPDGKRRCRTCKLIYTRRWHQQKKLLRTLTEHAPGGPPDATARRDPPSKS